MSFGFGSFDIGRVRGEVQAFYTNGQHMVGRVIKGRVFYLSHMFKDGQAILCP